MVVLDSDHPLVFEYPEADQAVQLRERLRLSADRDICTTAVSLEEQMRGRLAAIHQRQDVRLQVTCYSTKQIENPWHECSKRGTVARLMRPFEIAHRLG